MRYFWLCGLVLSAIVLLSIVGCTSGGDRPQALSLDELVARGEMQMESVTTNPLMTPKDAQQSLKSAISYFSAALQQEKTNTDAKMGYAFSNTLLGFYDLMEVLPAGLEQLALSAVTKSRSPQELEQSVFAVPYGIARASLARSGMRSSSIQTAQLRIASRTIPSMQNALPLFDDLEIAARNGADLRLRVFQGGRVRTIKFGVADIQLFSASANLVVALLNASIAYNLDVPAGSTVKPLPVDANGNGMFDSEDYLIPRPFLENYYNQKALMESCLQYLRYAATKAQEGTSLSGHTSGEYALIDVTDANTKAALERIAKYAAAIVVASTTEVSTNGIFGDGVTRTINLPKLTTITSLRALLPSFQTDDLTAPGVWPDPTFRGVITPGVPQGALAIKYNDIEDAY